MCYNNIKNRNKMSGASLNVSLYGQFQDKVYKNLKQPCEINPDCLAKRGAAQAICIRHCISEFCYNDIYAEDPVSC